MMVPAQAVQVSVSVPVLESGPQTPCFKFTLIGGRQKKHYRGCTGAILVYEAVKMKTIQSIKVDSDTVEMVLFLTMVNDGKWLNSDRPVCVLAHPWIR